ARDFCIFINVGLGEGAPTIGVPFFWPSAAMPNTVIDSWSSMVFLKFNGAKFSATDYPVLAKVFPSLVLPEARGDFIRIWDDGRGVDSGRGLLSCVFRSIRSRIGIEVRSAIRIHSINRELNFFYRFLTRFFAAFHYRGI